MISRSSCRERAFFILGCSVCNFACGVAQIAMAVLPPTHEERLAALSLNEDRSITIDRERILEGVGRDEALVDAMLA